jgi:hypothetical protein
MNSKPNANEYYMAKAPFALLDITCKIQNAHALFLKLETRFPAVTQLHA